MGPPTIIMHTLPLTPSLFVDDIYVLSLSLSLSVCVCVCAGLDVRLWLVRAVLKRIKSVDGWMDGWVDEWRNGRTDGGRHSLAPRSPDALDQHSTHYVFVRIQLVSVVERCAVDGWMDGRMHCA